MMVGCHDVSRASGPDESEVTKDAAASAPTVRGRCRSHRRSPLAVASTIATKPLRGDAPPCPHPPAASGLAIRLRGLHGRGRRQGLATAPARRDVKGPEGRPGECSRAQQRDGPRRLPTTRARPVARGNRDHTGSRGPNSVERARPGR